MSSMHKRAAKHAALPLAACAVAALCVLAALPATAQAQQAQRVAKDPETGQIRAPELDEMAAERAAPAARAAASSAARAAASTSAKPITGVRIGAKGFRVDSSRMVSSVVSRNADGTLSTQCVTGEAALVKALHGAVVGGAHDH